ncbi:chemotaxis protein [Pandoraea horticolens]|uniref:Chemotaxis protein n=1 Tax=Pandoraea horticolens TaxID=2508298 RepID=A0A5E4ZCW4_9BURK|nr:methyl-accepting chemotaxis protein [Pandoraea horticolens]VVE58130.1 chemotaxis protein [Pandoraea horticolens]
MTVSSLRTRIILIACATVIGALILSGITTYVIVRSSMMSTIANTLDAVARGNTLAVERWAAAKGQSVVGTAAAVEKGEQGVALTKLLGATNGFPISSIGWSDKSYFSSGPTPPDYDPTVRPWYKGATSAGKLTVVKPYADIASGKLYVSFAAPILRDGQTLGAVSGAVPLDAVQEVVKAVHPTPSSLAFVVSRDGLVIAHPDEKLMLKQSSDLARSLTPEVLANLERATEPMEVVLSGAAKLLKVQPVPGTDWFFVVALDKAEATAGLSRVLSATIVALIVLTLCAIGIASFFTSQAFRRLSQVRDAMDTIGSGGGDLTHRLDVVGHDEVAQISRSFNAFVDKISTVMIDVRAGVHGMTSATSEIEMGNRDLSQRTEASAGTLQETSAALTELTASVRQTAEAAEHATRLANDASEAAARGGDVVTGAVTTMSEIAQSSERITEIISVIDGIAFQTNILALNAAVEAARAGEQGRGFAVVAGEVRTLAQRSAAAAHEIKTLIEASVQNVKSGTQRVQAAGDTMGEIVDGISRVRRLIGEIHSAVTEQSTGISQIDRSVAEMDQSTQQNAALVEESAAASAMLSEQARNLADTVALFQLREHSRYGTTVVRNHANGSRAPHRDEPALAA